jgi:hypothetical protein
VPLDLSHEAGLAAAAADGELWNMRVTSVPEPGQTRKYIEDALKMRADGNRFAFAVTDEATGTVLGSTSLPRHPAGGEARGNWLHLVCQALPAHPCQHHRPSCS